MDLLERIDAMIDERHLLRHSFYRRWVEGTLPKASLQEYARQYFHFEASFPRFLSATHARCEDPQARAAILENLWDEEHGADNHRELWLRFAEGLGVDREDVLASEPNAATRALLETYWSAAREEPTAAAVAAVHAYERQVPAVAQSKIDGLRAGYGFAGGEPALTFFEVHGTLDVEHADAERRIISELGGEAPDRVLAATAAALDAWWGFLDAVEPAI